MREKGCAYTAGSSMREAWYKKPPHLLWTTETLRNNSVWSMCFYKDHPLHYGFLELQQDLECFQKTLVPYYKMSISCFLEDMDLISKIFTIMLDGPSGCFGAHVLDNVSCFGFPIFLRFTKLLLFQSPVCFSICVGILVSPQIKGIGLGAHGHVPKSRNHRNEGCWRIP